MEKITEKNSDEKKEKNSEEDPEKPLEAQGCCTLVPQRIVLSIMGFFGIVVAFAIRMCISVAIVSMVVPPSEAAQGTQDTMRPDGRYFWNQQTQGYILGSFNLGYVITHIPGGLLAQKIGGKWTLAFGVLWMATLNAVSPIAVQHGGGFVALLVIRICMGFGGGVTFPATSTLLAAWVPAKERGKLGSFVYGGSQIGSLLSFGVSGLMLRNLHWSTVFYFWSSLGIIWFILFAIFCSTDPASNRFIQENELNYLEREMGQTKRDKDLPSTPWLSMLTSVPVLALIAAQLGHDWIWYVITSYLPKYLADVLGMETHEIGLYASMPFVPMWVNSIASGFISDFLVNREYLTRTQARKLFVFLTNLSGVCMLLASYAGYNRGAVLACFILAETCLAFYYTSLKVNSLDLTPNYAGSLMAVTNGIGSFTGVAVPPLVGGMTPDSTLEQWRVVYWLTVIISTTRVLVYLIWGSAEVQLWNDPRKKNLSPEDERSKAVDNEVNKDIDEDVEAAPQNSKETNSKQ